ncbi:MAG: alkaline phosphatase family protein [Desulfocapsaceae bacterium]|nr:alkaline phosphatase family protein [Desulfocapsaceae bacterium]
MKTLIIGMDGAQVDSFKRGWTPYLASLIDKGEQLLLREDLISRGWSEIVTGQHGITTGALYDRAVLNGTHDWTIKFKLDDIPGLGREVKPLWQVLNERGYRVGIMNVPTAYPAPAVEGFFVSGGGGGGPVSQDAVIEQCYPEEILETLHDIGYIVDERLVSLLAEKKLYQPQRFFARLEKKNEKRTQAFIELAKRYEIDFGFIVYKSSSNLAEFLLLPEWERYLRGESSVDLEFIEAVKHYYQNFDEQIKQLVKSFPGAEVVLVSDHGMAKRRWLVNANTFLHERGFQKSAVSSRNIYDFVKHFKRWIPFSLRRALRNNSKIKTVYESMTTFDTKASLAFSMVIGDWAHGIYINDRERFGGPVKECDIQTLKEEIVRAFNTYPASVKHGFSAYAKPNVKTMASQYFPDVILDLPDGYMTSNEFQEFVTKYEIPKGPLGISSVTKGKLLCGKAHQPLAVNTNNVWKVRPTTETKDLRLIYDHILAVFK